MSRFQFAGESRQGDSQAVPLGLDDFRLAMKRTGRHPAFDDHKVSRFQVVIPIGKIGDGPVLPRLDGFGCFSSVLQASARSPPLPPQVATQGHRSAPVRFLIDFRHLYHSRKPVVRIERTPPLQFLISMKGKNPQGAALCTNLRWLTIPPHGPESLISLLFREVQDDPAPTLGDHIEHVVGVRPEEKMIRPHATLIIATM